MREKEKESSGVRLDGFGEGAECGRNVLPGQILCPRDLWVSAHFGGKSLRTEHVPEGETIKTFGFESTCMVKAAGLSH